MPLTPAEIKLAKAIGFDRDICEIVKKTTGGKLGRLKVVNDGDPEDAEGLSVAVGKADVHRLIDKIQPALAPHGYRAFWSNTLVSEDTKKSEEIAVLKTNDQYAIIQFQGANGENYGVTTAKLIKKLKTWEKLCKFHIQGASGDWVAIGFKSLPKDLGAFAEDIYNFCPDAVDQGVGLLREADHPKMFKAARRLYPKLSEKMQKKLDKQLSQVKQQVPPEMLAYFGKGPGSFDTPMDMGIRLLAYDLKQSKELFLWWD